MGIKKAGRTGKAICSVSDLFAERVLLRSFFLGGPICRLVRLAVQLLRKGSIGIIVGFVNWNCWLTRSQHNGSRMQISLEEHLEAAKLSTRNLLGKNSYFRPGWIDSYGSKESS